MATMRATPANDRVMYMVALLPSLPSNLRTEYDYGKTKLENCLIGRKKNHFFGNPYVENLVGKGLYINDVTFLGSQKVMILNKSD